MIYDCFTFFNELDLLEIRLNILNDVVDRFVLVEATKTHRGQDKPLFFKENKERFAKFLPKIEHVIVDKYPKWVGFFKQPGPWDLENHQRNAIQRGLKKCKRNDVILISDVDEIPTPEKILAYKDKPGFKIFQQRCYYYYLNCLAIDSNSPLICEDGSRPWNGTVMTHYKTMSTPQKVRDLRDRSPRRNRSHVADGGWHYSWLGGTEKVIEKLHTICHTELLTDDKLYDPTYVENSIKNGIDIFNRPNLTTRFETLEQHTHPYVIKNKEKYSHLYLS